MDTNDALRAIRMSNMSDDHKKALIAQQNTSAGRFMTRFLAVRHGVVQPSELPKAK
jgi:hypothetical protein